MLFRNIQSARRLLIIGGWYSLDTLMILRRISSIFWLNNGQLLRFRFFTHFIKLWGLLFLYLRFLSLPLEKLHILYIWWYLRFFNSRLPCTRQWSWLIAWLLLILQACIRALALLGEEGLLDIFLQNSGIGTIGGLGEPYDGRGILEGSQLLTAFNAIFKVLKAILCRQSNTLALRRIWTVGAEVVRVVSLRI
jgi:hypothetical protein